MVNLETLESAAALVCRMMPSTAQYCWPLSSLRVGANELARDLHDEVSPFLFAINTGPASASPMLSEVDFETGPDVAAVSSDHPGLPRTRR